MSSSRLTGLGVFALGLLIAPSTAAGQTPGKVHGLLRPQQPRRGSHPGEVCPADPGWDPPRDLPVENFAKIQFALNLRTAREIGLTIPPSVRFRAEYVIE
jgi:hypothetical protein